MWTSALLKQNAKYALRGRYGKGYLASLAETALPLLYSILTTVAMLMVILPVYTELFRLALEEIEPTPAQLYGYIEQFNSVYNRVNATQFLYYILCIFVVYPLQVGACRFFVHNRFGHVDLKLVKTGFTAGYSRTVGAMFVTNLFIWLWSLLFLIPGIVKSYEYYMVPYLLSDNPNLTGERAREISSMMTQGQKGRIFALDLSFLGWYLLGFLVPFVGATFVNPYYRATGAELYVCLRKNLLQSGCVTPAELNLAPPPPPRY